MALAVGVDLPRLGVRVLLLDDDQATELLPPSGKDAP